MKRRAGSPNTLDRSYSNQTREPFTVTSSVTISCTSQYVLFSVSHNRRVATSLDQRTSRLLFVHRDAWRTLLVMIRRRKGP